MTWSFQLFCPQSVWSWRKAEKQSWAAGCPTPPAHTGKHKIDTRRSEVESQFVLQVAFILFTALTSSRFHVRRLRARGSRLSGARGRSSGGLPLISGGLLVGITGGIFLKFRLSSNTRSTNWGNRQMYNLKNLSQELIIIRFMWHEGLKNFMQLLRVLANKRLSSLKCVVNILII